MKLGFYYHIPLTARDGGLYVPGYLGRFLDALAEEVHELYLLLHAASGKSAEGADYRLRAANVRWVDLGAKTPAWHRSVFHRSVLRRIPFESLGLDALLVRSPSPLAPYFSTCGAVRDRLAYMVVSDYGRGAEFIPNTSLRNRMVRLYSRWNDRVFKERLRNQLVIVNSRELYDTFAGTTESLHEVRTTTLSRSDFFERADTCLRPEFELLFTGRLVLDKGLVELLTASGTLRAEGFPVRVHLVGWEEGEHRPVESRLRALAGRLGMADHLFFHGRKPVGEELNRMYRMADVYVLPSYHEGFPRTIWEAMANSLPVVTTRVGSIPHYLRDGEDALVIEPGDADALAGALRTVLTDGELRRRLIRNGHRIATGNVVEEQSRRLVAIVAEYFRSRAVGRSPVPA